MTHAGSVFIFAHKLHSTSCFANKIKETKMHFFSTNQTKSIEAIAFFHISNVSHPEGHAPRRRSPTVEEVPLHKLLQPSAGKHNQQTPSRNVKEINQPAMLRKLMGSNQQY